MTCIINFGNYVKEETAFQFLDGSVNCWHWGTKAKAAATGRIIHGLIDGYFRLIQKGSITTIGFRSASVEAPCPEKRTTSPEQIEGINNFDSFQSAGFDISLLNLLIPLLAVVQ